MLTVADIMTRDVLVVPASASLGEVAAALAVRDVAAAPVRGAEGKIVGVVARADLMDAERLAALQAASAHPGLPPRAGAVMTAAFMAVHPGDSALDAVRLLVAEREHRLLVFHEGGDLAGIVTPADVLRMLLPPRAPAAPPPPASSPPPLEAPRTVH